MAKSNDKMNKFSVPLGLLDYLNPIFYMVTMIVINKNVLPELTLPYNALLCFSAIVSVALGFVIPTGKVLVGLGRMRFKLPVGLVFFVNLGIYVSGLTLLRYVFKLEWFFLLSIFAVTLILFLLFFAKTKKMNPIAITTGALGYVMIYVSLIVRSIQTSTIASVVFFALAIILFLFVCMIGFKGDLKSAKVHWLLEASNVSCQLFVMIGTCILFA